MDAVLRAAVIYVVLMVLFRLAGQRTLSELGAFDFVLLLVIGESTQQALLGDDFSVTNAVIVITTLLAIDVVISHVKQRSSRIDRWLEGTPIVVMSDGKLLRDRMDRLRIDEADILTAAREAHGLERLDEIRYAVLERSGGISIVPNRQAQA